MWPVGSRVFRGCSFNLLYYGYRLQCSIDGPVVIPVILVGLGFLRGSGVDCMGKEEGSEGWSGRAGERAPSRLGLGAAVARVPAPWGAGQQKIISLLLDLN